MKFTKQLTLTFAAAAFLFSATNRADAQVETRKIEVGAQFSSLFLGEFDPFNRLPNIVPIPSKGQYEPGLGGRLTYNFNRRVAIETEGNVFTRFKDPRPGRFANPEGGSKVQLLVGPKIGIRGKHIGVFGKVRPGFLHLRNYLAVVENSTVVTIQSPSTATFFNIDVGGVVEYYPSRRTVLRFDLGDTVIRYGNKAPRELNPSFTKHNLQSSIGFGFRF